MVIKNELIKKFGVTEKKIM